MDRLTHAACLLHALPPSSPRCDTWQARGLRHTQRYTVPAAALVTCGSWGRPQEARGPPRIYDLLELDGEGHTDFATFRTTVLADSTLVLCLRQRRAAQSGAVRWQPRHCGQLTRLRIRRPGVESSTFLGASGAHRVGARAGAALARVFSADLRRQRRGMRSHVMAAPEPWLLLRTSGATLRRFERLEQRLRLWKLKRRNEQTAMSLELALVCTTALPKSRKYIHAHHAHAYSVSGKSYIGGIDLLKALHCSDTVKTACESLITDDARCA